MNKRGTILIVVVFLEIIVLIAGRFGPTDGKLDTYAKRVIARCASASFKPACYDEEIPRLMNRISMEDAFIVTKLVQKQDPKYLYCHVLGHKLSYKETEKDSTKWKDVVARCPTTMCNNGCQHGAMMKRFNSETLTDEQIDEIKPDLASVCEPRGSWKPVEVERSMCYHALGHLGMYVTGAKIDRSIDLCKNITHKTDGRNYEQTCTEGVLMSLYQPLEPEDQALVKGVTPKKEDVPAFCNALAGEARDACFRESWPLFLDEIQKPEGLLKFCSYTKDENARWKCTLTSMNILTVYLVIGNDSNLNRLNEFCMALPQPDRSWCFGGAAARLLQIDPAYVPKSIEVCEFAKDPGCWKSLGNMIGTTYTEGSSERKKACLLLPPARQSSCSSGL